MIFFPKYNVIFPFPPFFSPFPEYLVVTHYMKRLLHHVEQNMVVICEPVKMSVGKRQHGHSEVKTTFYIKHKNFKNESITYSVLFIFQNRIFVIIFYCKYACFIILVNVFDGVVCPKFGHPVERNLEKPIIFK